MSRLEEARERVATAAEVLAGLCAPHDQGAKEAAAEWVNAVVEYEESLHEYGADFEAVLSDDEAETHRQLLSIDRRLSPFITAALGMSQSEIDFDEGDLLRYERALAEDPESVIWMGDIN